MKVCFYTPYFPTKDYASSRIRSYYPYLGMLQLGIDAHLGFVAGCDFYVINKRADNRIIKRLLDEQRKGAKIVYDLCDLPPQQKLLDAADFITCPTEIQKLKIQQLCTKPVKVWRDCIDFGLTKGRTLKYLPNSVGWFGNWNNAQLPMETLKTYNKRKYIISDSKKIQEVYGHLLDESWRLIDWNPDTFLEAIKTIGLAVFPVPHSELYKSDNKTLLALASGVPVLVSEGSAGYNFLEGVKTGLGDASLIQQKTIEAIAPEQIAEAQKVMFQQRSYKAAAEELRDILYIRSQ